MKNKFFKVAIIALFATLNVVGIAVALSNNFNTLFTKTVSTLHTKNLHDDVDDSSATYTMANDFFMNFKNIDPDNNPLKQFNSIDKFFDATAPIANLSNKKIIEDVFNKNFQILAAKGNDITFAPSNDKILFTYNDGGTNITINSHDSTNYTKSGDIYVVQGLTFAMTIIFDCYIQDQAAHTALSTALAYNTQITNNFALALAITDALPASYVNFFNSINSNDYLFNTFLNGFFYNIFSKEDHKALTINAKLFNNFLPSILLNNYAEQPTRLQPFINDGTFTLLPTQLLNSDKFLFDNVIDLSNYQNNHMNSDYHFWQGIDITNKYYGIRNLINAIPDNKEDTAWLFNNWFITLKGHSKSIMSSYLYSAINQNLNNPVATSKSLDTQFQFFTVALAPNQNHKFLKQVEYDLNLTVFKYPADIDCWRYFVTDDQLKNNVINAIIGYNLLKYNDFTAGKITIILVSTILVTIILVYIIYRIYFHYISKKRYFKYQKGQK